MYQAIKNMQPNLKLSLETVRFYPDEEDGLHVRITEDAGDIDSLAKVNSERLRFISFSGIAYSHGALVCKLNGVITAEDIGRIEELILSRVETTANAPPHIRRFGAEGHQHGLFSISFGKAQEAQQHAQRYFKTEGRQWTDDQIEMTFLPHLFWTNDLNYRKYFVGPLPCTDLNLRAKQEQVIAVCLGKHGMLSTARNVTIPQQQMTSTNIIWAERHTIQRLETLISMNWSSARQRGEDKLFSYREYEKREKRSSQESQEEHHMSTPRGQFVSFSAGTP